MKQQLYILLFFATTFNSSAQKSLKKILWKSVDSCYNEIKEDGGNFIELKEDISNGYLRVHGFTGTCGCGCFKEVAAFKTVKGNFVTLVRENNACYFSYKIASNKNLQDIFPKEVSISTFISKVDASRFYFDIKPPQNGTKVTLTIKPIPLGVENINKTPFDYKTNTKIENFQFFQNFVHKIKDGSTLDFILKKNYTAINKKELSLINEKIKLESRYDSKNWNLEKISSKLAKLYKIYQDFESRNYDAFILDWNREFGKFYIKKRIKKQKSITFLQFLKETNFWRAIC